MISGHKTEYFRLLNKILENKTKIKPLERENNFSDFEGSNNEICENKILKVREK